MKDQDIEERAEEKYYLSIGGREFHSEGSNCDDNYRSGFITGYQKASLEEREEGKEVL